MILVHEKGILVEMLIKAAGFGGSREYFKGDLTGNLYFPVSRGSIFALRMQIGRLWRWNNEKRRLFI